MALEAFVSDVVVLKDRHLDRDSVAASVEDSITRPHGLRFYNNNWAPYISWQTFLAQFGVVASQPPQPFQGSVGATKPQFHTHETLMHWNLDYDRIFYDELDAFSSVRLHRLWQP